MRVLTPPEPHNPSTPSILGPPLPALCPRFLRERQVSYSPAIAAPVPTLTPILSILIRPLLPPTPNLLTRPRLTF